MKRNNTNSNNCNSTNRKMLLDNEEVFDGTGIYIQKEECRRFDDDVSNKTHRGRSWLLTIRGVLNNNRCARRLKTEEVVCHEIPTIEIRCYYDFTICECTHSVPVCAWIGRVPEIKKAHRERPSDRGWPWNKCIENDPRFH